MMKLQMVVAVLFASIVVVLSGCSTGTVDPGPVPITDQQALQSAVTSIDSVADFSASDEMTIDDNGMRSSEYDGLAKIDANDLASVSAVFADSVYPVKWGRHIFWHQVTRKYDIVISPGDSSALVTITKILPGEFWVGIGFKTADTVVVDTIIKKPFTQIVKRKVRFIDDPLYHQPDADQVIDLLHTGHFSHRFDDPVRIAAARIARVDQHGLAGGRNQQR